MRRRHLPRHADAAAAEAESLLLSRRMFARCRMHSGAVDYIDSGYCIDRPSEFPSGSMCTRLVRPHQRVFTEQELIDAQRPICIPVTWDEPGAYLLAYHHGWIDARLYQVVRIRHNGPHSPFDGYTATVDDFGNLVPLTDKQWIQRGSLELH